MNKICPQCGKKFLTRRDGLEGLFCSDNACGYWEESTEPEADITNLYSEERLKPIRGVPMHSIKFGSETKGRVEIQIPVFASDNEAKAIINTVIDYLEYSLNKVKEKDLDIFTSRSKKE